MLTSCITDSNGQKNIAGAELPIIYDGWNLSVLEFQLAAAFQNSIFIPTNDGVWEFIPEDEEWKSQPLLKGKKVIAIYAHTGLNKLFIAVEPVSIDETSLYTYDGKKVSAVSHVPRDPNTGLAERFYFFTERPGHPNDLYANLSGEMIAVSKDRGNKWFRKNYESESYFGYPCPLGFVQTEEEYIFQGCEIPLDAWLGRYKIDSNDPVKLSEFKKLITVETWDNRRPNEIVSMHEALYIGQEGALTRFKDGEFDYILSLKRIKSQLHIPT